MKYTTEVRMNIFEMFKLVNGNFEQYNHKRGLLRKISKIIKPAIEFKYNKDYSLDTIIKVLEDVTLKDKKLTQEVKDSRLTALKVGFLSIDDYKNLYN